MTQKVTFFTDEDVNGKGIRIARMRGVSIITIFEVGLSGADDDRIPFALAAEKGYVLVGANRLHLEPLFYEWIETKGDHPGLVLISALANQLPGVIADDLEAYYELGTPAFFRNKIVHIKPLRK